MRSTALLVLAMLVACSSAAPAATGPTPSPSASASPTASAIPTPDLTAFGRLYLSLVGPANTALCTYNKVVEKPGVTLQQEKAASTALALAERAFSDALRKVTWPPDVAIDMRDLLKAEAAFSSRPDRRVRREERARIRRSLRSCCGWEQSNVSRCEPGACGPGDRECPRPKLLGPAAPRAGSDLGSPRQPRCGASDRVGANER
jgi:hypothetical protein